MKLITTKLGMKNGFVPNAISKLSDIILKIIIVSWVISLKQSIKIIIDSKGLCCWKH
jgi:hypothetical protein